MATIQSQLVLGDGMSGPLRHISSALGTVLNSFESMQAAAGRPIDTASIQKAREELARGGAQLDELEAKTRKADGAFGKLLKTFGLVMAARKAFDTLKAGIDYASDLAEVQNVVDVTFGNSAAAIDAWAKECLSAYGMNEVSAKRYAGALGAMMKSSGLAGDAVVGMSRDMVGLAGDMASFYNLDLETAFQKIRSGISGETEPLKQLGINMSVANLEAYALAQGIEKSYSAMSQAEQVTLRYSYLMSTTADAQGDFARTQDSWANQTRLLSESWTEFTGVLAGKLLPLLTSVVAWFNGLFSFLSENAGTVNAVLLGVAAAAGVLAAAWLAQAAAAWISKAAHEGLFAALLANPIVWIAVAVGAVIAVLYNWIQAIGGVKNAWELCGLAITVAWNWLKLSFYNGVNLVMGVVEALQLCWQRAGVAISNFMGDLRASVLSILQSLVNGAIDIINWFIGLLNKIPFVNIQLIEKVTFGTTAQLENEAAKQQRAAELAAYEQSIADARGQRDAELTSMRAELDSSVAALTAAHEQMRTSAAAGGGGSGGGGGGSGGGEGAGAGGELAGLLDGIGKDTAGINRGVGSVAASLEDSAEEMKYLRDLAEMRYVQNFVTLTPTVAVDAKISETVDIDEVAAKIEEKIEGEFALAAERTYA